MCPRPSMLINTYKHTCKWTRAPACLQLFTSFPFIQLDLLIQSLYSLHIPHYNCIQAPLNQTQLESALGVDLGRCN